MSVFRYVIAVLLSVCGSVNAADCAAYSGVSEWVLYNTGNSGLPGDQVHCIAIDRRDMAWIATANGLARFAGRDWTVYNQLNAGFPDSHVQCVQPDNRGNVWVGTMKGVGRFDGETWTTFSTENSPLPDNDIASIHADIHGRVWIATARGLAVVDEANWTIYDESNSLILNDLVLSVVVDSSGTAWVGTFDPFLFNGRLLRFDGSTWKRYRLEDYELNSSFPGALAVDENNVVWMGTKGTTGGAVVKIDKGEWTVFRRFDSEYSGSAIKAIAREGSSRWMATATGLARHDGENWMFLDKSVTGLPEAVLTSVAVDSRGNKWVGMLQSGVAVYNKDGVVTSSQQIENSEPTALLSSFPNPAGMVSHVHYRLETAGTVRLALCDLLGREIAVFVHGYQQAGEHSATVDMAGVPEGMYICVLQTTGRTDTHTVVARR